MIIPYNKLNQYNKKVVMIDGGFDPLHQGHIKYINETVKFGLPVFCNMQSDEYFINRKKRNTILSEQHRALLLDAVKGISYVHICKTTTADVLQKLKPLKYIKGADWKQKGLPKKEIKICKSNNIEVVFLDTMINSSTNIVDNFLDHACKSRINGNIDDFEKYTLNQEEFDSSYYDDHYFQGGWRANKNSYSITKRRELEGKNPRNIKDVFQPTRVLDFGCGPGALMLFLHEIRIDVYGLDFSQAAKDEAPAEIKDRIYIGPVTEYHDFGVDFDLVICRETFEHLTVIQVVKAVQVLAQTTKKYLYITTRFHPNPKTLLDVTTQPEVDPSHITLLNKDFLRLLFIAQGLKTRRDLEEKMDWKKYGRVLVFEKNT